MKRQMNLRLNNFETEKADFIQQTFDVTYVQIFRFCWSTEKTLDDVFGLATQYKKQHMNEKEINYKWLINQGLIFK